MYLRGKVWWTTVRGVRESLGTDDKKAAKALEASWRKARWEEDRMGVKPPRTWEESVVRYLKECEGQAGYDLKVAIMRWWTERLGCPVDIRQISRDKVGNITDKLATVEPSSSNTTLNYKIWVLHNLLKKATEEWEWIEKTPKFRTYPKPEGSRKSLSRAEWLSLYGAMTGDLADFCTLALATGLRSGKLMDLTWQQYDASKSILLLSGRGTKRANSVPLNQTAVNVLEARRRAQTVHLTQVFPEIHLPPIIQYKKEWAEVRKIKGLEKVSPHVLRHTFNTWLAEAGIAKEAREYLMGHRAMDTNAIYTHWAEETLRPAVEVIDRILGEQDERLRSAQR